MTKSTNKSFVSVIIPVFNDHERLAICLQTLEEQTYPKERYEVIVVDNGSSVDMTLVVAPFPHAQLIREARVGSYAARNKGLSIAKGTVIAFTDADCIPKPDWIEKGVNCIQSVENCGLVAGHIEIFFRNPTRPNGVELYEYAIALRQKKNLDENNFGATANVFTLRKAIDSVGAFNDQLKSGGDKEWGHRVFFTGYKLIYAPDASVQHPARYTLGQLYNKITRMTGGHYTIKQHGLMKTPLVKDNVPTRRSSTLNTILSIYRNEKTGGLKNTFIILWVAFLVVLFKQWEILRLTLGGRTKHT